MPIATTLLQHMITPTYDTQRYKSMRNYRFARVYPTTSRYIDYLANLGWENNYAMSHDMYIRELDYKLKIEIFKF